MLTLLTGQPGHGKTAYGLTRARELQAKGRVVYAHGVRDLEYEKIGFHRLEDPTKWQDLPDGSVVLIDECYTTFPSRNPGSKVPDHVEAMARHRHRGFDFILIAQQGLQLDPFLRGLYEEHIHVKKKFGKMTELRRWSSYQGNVKAACSDKMDWVRPDEIFQFYTSTVMDTSRLHVPKWLKLTIALLLVLFGLLYFLKLRYTARIAESEAVAGGPLSAAAPGVVRDVSRASPGAADGRPRYRSPAEYAQAHLPRFASMPHTAPIYDGVAPTTHPQVFCMSSEAGLDANGVHRDASVTCLTEQGTRYHIEAVEARDIARHGTPYDHYRPQQPVQVAQAPAVASAPAMPTAVADRGAGVLIQAEPLPRTVTINGGAYN